jgi:NDP-sugar pyrophosphorylase family protein
VIVGVVPAAGHAERLSGLIGGSKELVRVHGRPVIDGLLDLLHFADEVRVVVRPAKRDLIEHLRRRATVVEGEPRTVAESIALGLEGLRDDDVVLVGFPDTLFGPPDAFERLVDGLRGPHEAVLGAFTFAEPSRSDVLELDGQTVVHVHVRPQEPSSNMVWGCLAARRRALQEIDRYSEPGLLLDELARAGKVAAVRFAGELVDLGTPEALAAAR